MIDRKLPYSVLFFLVITLLVIFTPFVVIIVSLMQEDHGTLAHLVDTILTDVITNTLLVLVGVAVVASFIGVSTAWWVVMYDFPGKKLCEWGLIMPLAVPAYVMALIYGHVFDVAGPVQFWLRDSMAWSVGDYWFPSIRSLPGAVFVLSLALYPYIYLMARSAFLSQATQFLEVGRALGVSKRRIFGKIMLPMARPAIIAGLSLVLMEVIADIGVVYLFGIDTFTTAIYRTWYNLFDSVAAAKLSAFLMIFVVVLIWMERVSRRQARYVHGTESSVSVKTLSAGGIKQLLILANCWLPILCGLIFPVALLVYWSVSTAALADVVALMGAVSNSLILAVVAACVTLIVAFVFVYITRFYRSSLVARLVRVATIGYAIPGSVIAVGVFIMLNGVDRALHGIIPAWGLWLSGSLIVLVVAYVIRFLALPFNSFEAGLSKISDSMDEVAGSLGSRLLHTIRVIHMPLIKGSIITSALIVMVDVIKELPATLILRPFNMDTLAIKVFELATDERILASAPAALLLVLLGAVPTLFIMGHMSMGHRPRRNKS